MKIISVHKHIQHLQIIIGGFSMSNSRSTRRPGNGVHLGSINPSITVSDTAPDDPNHKDLWFDITGDPGVWKWYDSDTDTWYTGVIP
jgi:hypothetical protein